MVLKDVIEFACCEPSDDDDQRRAEVFAGRIFAFAPTTAALALATFARQMVQDALPGRDPQRAQYEMPVEDYVQVIAALKPRFIHHPRTRQLLADLFEGIGCDLKQTYLDVPRMRAVTSDGYLTAGVGYAHPPHRDTWYSAPLAQLNFWMPLYEITPESTMAFHPAYWDRAVRNSSREFNYYDWNATGRANASQYIKQDTRKQPQLEEPVTLDPQYRVDVPPGGFVLFSGAQLHSTVPNTSGLTRYSLDFRAVNIDDLRARRAAPNLDSDCTGTSLRDFLRGTDGTPLPEDVVEMYDDGTAAGYAQLVYAPPAEPTH